MYENVRPSKWVNAVKYLMKKKLFRCYVQEGLDTNWNDHFEEMRQSDWNEFIADADRKTAEELPPDKEQTDETAPSEETTSADNTKGDESDAWSEDEEEENSNPYSLMDTIMFEQITQPDNQHVTEIEADGQHNISVAPSEGNIPISIFSDDTEELAYPSMFCGESRPTNVQREIMVNILISANLNCVGMTECAQHQSLICSSKLERSS